MGVDSNGAPFTLFKDVLVNGKSVKKEKQPYNYAIPEQTPDHLTVQLNFVRHYQEPHVSLKVSMADLLEHESIEYMMVFDAAKTGDWELVLMNNKNRDMIGLAEFNQIKPSAEEEKKEAAGKAQSRANSKAGTGSHAKGGVQPRNVIAQVKNGNKPLPFSHHFPGMEEQLKAIGKHPSQ